jgi:hypothetical protein
MGQAPNMKHVVEEMAARHPDLFARAHHEGDAQAWRFNQALAWELFSKHDRRWGMNFKRDGNELSMDVLAFRVGPTDRHVECFDVIEGAGGGNAQPAWQDITDFATMGQPGTARWAEPKPEWAAQGGGGQPAPQPTPQPAPQPKPTDLEPVLALLRAVQSALTQQQAEIVGIRDQVAAIAARADTSDQISANLKHLNDRLVQLGLQIDASGPLGRLSGTAKLPE